MERVLTFAFNMFVYNLCP